MDPSVAVAGVVVIVGVVIAWGVRTAIVGRADAQRDPHHQEFLARVRALQEEGAWRLTPGHAPVLLGIPVGLTRDELLGSPPQTWADRLALARPPAVVVDPHPRESQLRWRVTFHEKDGPERFDLVAIEDDHRCYGVAECHPALHRSRHGDSDMVVCIGDRTFLITQTKALATVVDLEDGSTLATVEHSNLADRTTVTWSDGSSTELWVKGPARNVRVATDSRDGVLVRHEVRPVSPHHCVVVPHPAPDNKALPLLALVVFEDQGATWGNRHAPTY
ncbi:MAG: hypothetical protein ACFCGT_17805 [Sandaracinaceae bacterium]